MIHQKPTAAVDWMTSSSYLALKTISMVRRSFHFHARDFLRRKKVGKGPLDKWISSSLSLQLEFWLAFVIWLAFLQYESGHSLASELMECMFGGSCKLWTFQFYFQLLKHVATEFEGRELNLRVDLQSATAASSPCHCTSFTSTEVKRYNHFLWRSRLSPRTNETRRNKMIDRWKNSKGQRKSCMHESLKYALKNKVPCMPSILVSFEFLSMI